jgi:heat-inducible transcriptional repressor
MDDRKATILQAVVEAYIETAQPVGSSVVARMPGISVSSATVRNEMAALERDGYLAQPHTSAGRVPTEAGYRFFVDRIGAHSGRLGELDARRVRSFFEHARGEIEQRLQATSQLLADLTSYAAVVIGPGQDPASVRSVQLVELSAFDVLVVAVLSDGAVVKRHLEMSEQVDPSRLARAGERLRRTVDGHPLSHLPAVAHSGDPFLDGLLDRATAALAQPVDSPVFVGGTSRMAAQFDAVDTVRAVLTILEEQLLVVTLLGDLIERGLSVAIGSETGLQPLADCAVVVAPFSVEGEASGAIGVVGPTRMDYPRALAAVTVVSNRLGRSLESGT